MAKPLIMANDRAPPRAGDYAPQDTEARMRLEAAIGALEAARQDLSDAMHAAGDAQERQWTASTVLEDIRERPADDPAAMADAFFCAFKAGGSIDAAMLERSASKARECEVAAKRDLDVWTRTVAACEAAITAKEAAVARAKREVDAAVACVILDDGAAARLMDGLEAMQKELVARRVALKFMQARGLIGDEHAGRAKKAPERH